jgi:hypothetical protein
VGNKIDNVLIEKGIYQAFKRWLEHWVTKLVIILLTAFNAYILFVLGNDKQAETFKSNFKLPAEFIITNAGSIVMGTVFISGLYGVLLSFLNKKCDNIEKEHKDLQAKYQIALVVLQKIEDVVIAKRKRFAALAHRYVNTPAVQKPKHKTLFDGITHPEEQIELIIESLRDCLIAIYPNETIKVALMRVVNSNIDDWVCHSPYDTKPRTSIVELRDPNSTFSKCIKQNKIIIVADTQNEIQKPSTADIMYIKGQSDPSEKWCQVCAPIHSINSNSIIFIISIAIKRENVIVQENVAYLEWILGFFKSRLALEHSLDQLKKKVL